MSRRLVLVALFVCAVASRTAAQALAPKPPANADCLACHEDPTIVRANGTSVAVLPSKLAASSHGALSCVDCHAHLATVTEYPHAEDLEPATCASCHEDAVKKYDAGIHAQARAAGTTVAATCADCHGSHDIQASGDTTARTHPLNLPGTCGRCHGDPETIRRGKIGAGDVLSRYQDSIHGQAVARAGLVVAATCVSCHGSHEILRKANPASSVHRANVPATCGKCHQGIQVEYARGIHAEGITRGNKAAPSCAGCHTAHDIVRADEPEWKLSVIRECGTCHAKYMETYRDTFHGQVTALGFTRVATCADCHNAHGIRPKEDPRSTVSAARRVETCRRCHANANDNFARYDPHADPRDRGRNAVLFWAARFMNVLLLGVFSAFGIHTALWFPRSLQARRQRKRETRR